MTQMVDVDYERFLYDLQKDAAKQAYDYASLEQQASAEAAKTAATNASTWMQGQIANMGNRVKIAELLSKLTGPRNAFVQQAVISGLNSMGMTRAVASLTGGPTPTRQGPQAVVQPISLATLMADTGLVLPGEINMANNPYASGASAGAARSSFTPGRIAPVPPKPVVPEGQRVVQGMNGGKYLYPQDVYAKAQTTPDPIDATGNPDQNFTDRASAMQRYTDAVTQARADIQAKAAAAGDREPPVSDAQHAPPGSPLWASEKAAHDAWEQRNAVAPEDYGLTTWQPQHSWGDPNWNAQDLFTQPDQNLQGASGNDPTANYGDVVDGQTYVGADPNGYGDPNNWVDAPADPGPPSTDNGNQDEPQPGFSDGTAFVPQTGRYGLTAGEMVIPKDQAQQIRSASTFTPTSQVGITDPGYVAPDPASRFPDTSTPVTDPNHIQGAFGNGTQNGNADITANNGGAGLTDAQIAYVQGVRNAAVTSGSPQAGIYAGLDDLALAKYLAKNDQSGWGNDARTWGGLNTFTAGQFGDVSNPSQVPSFTPEQKQQLDLMRGNYAGAGDWTTTATAGLDDIGLYNWIKANDLGAYAEWAKSFEPDPYKRLVAELPALNKIVARNWIRFSPDTQDYLKGAFEARGDSATDLDNTIAHMLPGKAAFTAGHALVGR